MPYLSNKKSTQLDILDDTTLAQSDVHIVGDVSDSGRAKAITQDKLEDYIANSTNFITQLIANNTFITQITGTATPVITKGDIYTRSATVPARLAVGTNGQVLSADSTEATGLKWIAMTGGGGGGGTKLAINTTEITVTGTITETTLFTVSIPAGTLGTNDAIRFTMPMTSSLGINQCTLRVKYGATTIGTVTAFNGGGASFVLSGVIIADNSVSVQKSQIDINQSGTENTSTPFNSTINSAISNNLVVTAELLNVGDSITAESIIVEKISNASTPIKTYIPKPVALESGGVFSFTLDTNTTMYAGIINIPTTITVTQLSINVGSVNTSGTIKYILYSEDGLTKYIDATTGTISAVGVNTTAITSTSLQSGNYYLCVHTIGATFINTSGLTISSTNFQASGKYVVSGTLAITASTTPSTINPATDITFSVAAIPLIRFDA